VGEKKEKTPISTTESDESQSIVTTTTSIPQDIKIFDCKVFAIGGKLGRLTYDIIALIEKNGGLVSKTVECAEYLIVKNGLKTKSSKYDIAEKKPIPIVFEQWLYDSVSSGKCLDMEGAYLAYPVKPKAKAKAKSKKKKEGRRKKSGRRRYRHEKTCDEKTNASG